MAIDYALAKELEDAGFPQGGAGRWISPPEKIIARRRERVYVPTMAELIDLCGHSEKMSVHLVLSGQHITASKGPYVTSGISPDEALARLWLVLSKGA